MSGDTVTSPLELIRKQTNNDIKQSESIALSSISQYVPFALSRHLLMVMDGR